MIKVNNVIKEYGDFALNVNLHIRKGNVTGLIGKNGAGKSTLYKAILNLINPDDGFQIPRHSEYNRKSHQS